MRYVKSGLKVLVMACLVAGAFASTILAGVAADEISAPAVDVAASVDPRRALIAAAMAAVIGILIFLKRNLGSGKRPLDNHIDNETVRGEKE